MSRLIYGINPVMEALKSGVTRLSKVIVSDKKGKATYPVEREAHKRGVAVEYDSPKSLDVMTKGAAHQGVVGVATGEFEYVDIEDAINKWKASGKKAFFVLLDSVQDPQNMGSIIRGADVFGAHAVVITKDRCAPVTPAVTKASAGATEHVMIAMVVNLAAAIRRLKEENVWVAAIEAGEGKLVSSEDLNIDIAVVIGSEGSGIRKLVKEECDFALSIPMSGRVNSLNAAQAGVVVMYEIRRQRGA
ncbi:MAG: 23S rRNA (guanosine(2251)-2'-O)-methyltransferase RlmB [Deltaproteobacteria bacterium]|nr:23S rRNA (guanosine(2251)-2'-O)-methyltransferase RlmB [Deltaproteobacteria bacterium]